MFHTILPFILLGEIRKISMNSLIAFNFENQVVRTIYDDKDNPLFCLKDVCAILELSNQSNVIAALRDEMFPEGVMENITPTKKIALDTTGGAQELNFITEGQLYFVICRSRVQKARLFRHWVFNEVLPAIRKNGYYGTKEQEQINSQVIKDKLEIAAIVLKSDSPKEMDAYYKALTGESILEKIKENMPNAD